MKIYNSQNTKLKRVILRQNQTPAERMLWDYLRSKQFHGLKFFRQYGIGQYIADFYCPELKIAIEIDGDQHLLKDNAEYDRVRRDYFSAMKIKTLRFRNHDFKQGSERLMAIIETEFFKIAPSLLKEGERGS